MSDLAVDDGDELEELSRTKVGGKRVLLIVVALLVLLLGGGAEAFFTGMLDQLLGGSEEMAEDGGHGAADGEHGEEGGEKLAGISAITLVAHQD